MRHLSTDLRRDPHQTAHTGTRRRRPRHPHLPPLFYAVRNRRWPDVIHRARSHPHEILIHEDLSGETPLHVACRLDPPADVIRSLLSASSRRNVEGATPLHLAASHRCSADVIRALIEHSSDERDDNQGDDGTEEDHIVIPPGSNSKPPCTSSYSPTTILTRMGRAPIHYACMSFRGLSVEAFKVLLEATLKACDDESCNVNAKEEMDGEEDDDTIGDAAAEVEVERCATNAVTLHDVTGQTPMGLLFRRYRERVRCVIKMVESSEQQNHQNGNATAAAQAVQADLGELWEKARLIVAMLAEQRLQQDGNVLQTMMDAMEVSSSPAEAAAALEAATWAAEKHQTRRAATHDQRPPRRPSSNFLFDGGGAAGSGREFRIVHASVALTGYGCPSEMIRLAISVHPNQVREMDENGNLPLHIATVASSYSSLQQQASSSSENNNPAASGGDALNDDDSSLISDASSLSLPSATAFDRVIQILLRHYPASVRIPHGKTGRLPLVLAIDAGQRSWNDGIRTLLEAYPPALESRDVCPKLYPSILSLVSRRSNDMDGRGVGEGGGPVWARWKKINRRKRNKAASYKGGKAFGSVFELVRAKPNVMCDAREGQVVAAKKAPGGIIKSNILQFVLTVPE